MSDEDFDVDSLATYLHLTPAQIEKMASRGKLPGRRVGGQWRFSRSEIHHWFEDRIGISDEMELEHVERVLDSQAAKDEDSIARLLTPHSIWIPLSARTKNSVIETMCRRAADCGLLWEPDKMAAAIKSRENLHPTALENGVALMHPRRPLSAIIGEPFLALGKTTTGIPFGGPRGILTDIFFLIASVDEPGHLRTLARLSRIIAQAEFLNQLRNTDDPRLAWDLVRQTDQELE